MSYFAAYFLRVPFKSPTAIRRRQCSIVGSFNCQWLRCCSFNDGQDAYQIIDPRRNYVRTSRELIATEAASCFIATTQFFCPVLRLGWIFHQLSATIEPTEVKILCYFHVLILPVSGNRCQSKLSSDDDVVNQLRCRSNLLSLKMVSAISVAIFGNNARTWEKVATSTSLTCEIPSGAAQFRHFPFIVRKFYCSFCAKLCLRPSGISQVMSTPAASLGDTILRSWILQKLLTRCDELIDYEKVCRKFCRFFVNEGKRFARVTSRLCRLPAFKFLR